jgi:mRNA interferase MazF
MLTPILKRGDIVLVPFPFTSLKDLKVRPGVIISPDPQQTDVLIAFISSSVDATSMSSTDYFLPTTHFDFPATGLKKVSTFKMRKFLFFAPSRLDWLFTNQNA